MKGIIVVDKGSYFYHEAAAFCLSSVLSKRRIETEVCDLRGERQTQQSLMLIQRSPGDILFTLDFAGFDVLTELDNLFYNVIPVRMAHFILQKPIRYPEGLKGRINFSMFFYCAEEETERLLAREYKNIENVRCIPELSELTAVGGETLLLQNVMCDILAQMEV